MRKFLIFLLLGALGIKFGSDYLFSPEFEKKADTTKAPWTCQFENFMGQFNILMSHYDDSKIYFDRTLARCPDTAMAEEAAFGAAQSMEKLGQAREAAVAYSAFADKYPTSSKTRTARRAAQLLGAP